MTKLAYVTTWEPLNIRSFSGTSFYLAKGLQDQGMSLEFIGPLIKKKNLGVEMETLWHRYIARNRYRADRAPAILKEYARQTTNRLIGLDVDLIFSLGTVPIAYLKTDKPVVNYMDTTFQGALNYYPGFSNLCKATIRNGQKIEKLTLDRCDLLIFPSDWAAQIAIDYYRVDPAKVKVVPFGANIENKLTSEVVERLVSIRPKNRCNLFFIGVDWNRKGGPIAYEVAMRLNQLGLETQLTVVGCRPALSDPLPPFVRSLGFLNKGNPDERERIYQLFKESHFIILPSRSEYFGIVFCEANSFGVPCLATDTGGIPTVICPGRNGNIFSINANIEEYCNYILRMFQDYECYKQLAMTSFFEYKNRLNWEVASQTIDKLIEEIL